MVSAAPVVLCSVEVLTTLAARAVIFPRKANFVALALQSPALLFGPFHEFGKPNSVVLGTRYNRGGNLYRHLMRSL